MLICSFKPNKDRIFGGCLPMKMGGWGTKSYPCLKSVTYILMWWNLVHLYLPKLNPINIWITWNTPWVLMTSTFFRRKSANFAISRNIDIDWIFIDTIIFKFHWVFKDGQKSHFFEEWSWFKFNNLELVPDTNLKFYTGVKGLKLKVRRLMVIIPSL